MSLLLHEIHSSSEEGGSFTPAIDTPKPVTRRSSTPAPMARLATPPTRCLRVLVVEDNHINRLVAQGLIQRCGHVIVTVNDGQQAIAEWRKGAYDVIFMDLQMPVMDGAVATQCIREEEKVRGGHIPIIAMTAHALNGIEAECRSYGMDGYIAKPLRRQAFINFVENLLQLQKAQPAPASPTAETPWASSAVWANDSGQLVHRENMVQYVGANPKTQQQLVDLCLVALAAKLPLLRRAMNQGDRTTVQRLAHSLRSSLGMLGLPAFLRLAEAIEYEHDILDAKTWQQSCEQFCQMLEQVRQELQELRAA